MPVSSEIARSACLSVKNSTLEKLGADLTKGDEA